MEGGGPCGPPLSFQRQCLLRVQVKRSSAMNMPIPALWRSMFLLPHRFSESRFPLSYIMRYDPMIVAVVLSSTVKLRDV